MIVQCSPLLKILPYFNISLCPYVVKYSIAYRRTLPPDTTVIIIAKQVIADPRFLIITKLLLTEPPLSSSSVYG